MTSTTLPLHRARWTTSSRLEHVTVETPKHKAAKGTHHLIVSLHVKLAESRWLWPILQLVVCFVAAVLLLCCVQRGMRGTSGWGDIPANAATQEEHRLLLASHNRLMWYYPLQDAFKVLHEGEGVHYGMFPGEPQPGHPQTVWNVIRPHNWRPATNKEHLVLLDAQTGVELKRIQVPSRFTHDAVRVGDRVYICSTGDGSLLELHYPNMTLVRRMPLFTSRDHPNTLAALTADGHHLWVLLHNLGQSDLVKVYVGPGRVPYKADRIHSVGLKAHGLVAWGQELILLDSANAALVSMDTGTEEVLDLYVVPEEGKFLKGLAVIDDIAYFGITTWAERSVRDSPENNCELGAYDLANNKLLWRRQVPTAGLLNIIGAPHLAADSTYKATYSPSAAADEMRNAASVILMSSQPTRMPSDKAVLRQAVNVLEGAGYPPRSIHPTDYWSSGWPRLSLEPKKSHEPEEAGLQLPLFQANVTALKARVLGLPDEVWSKPYQEVHNAVMTGRTSNMDRFKPGVEGIVLMFSDNEGKVVYEFPFYRMLRKELEPLLLEILGPLDFHNIVRLQLARMAPGTSDIKIHQDMGGYAADGHRIHVPITTHPLVSFAVCPDGDTNAASILQGVAAAMSAAAGTAAAQQQTSAPGDMHERMVLQSATSSMPAQHWHPTQQQQQDAFMSHLSAHPHPAPLPSALVPLDAVPTYHQPQRQTVTNGVAGTGRVPGADMAAAAVVAAGGGGHHVGLGGVSNHTAAVQAVLPPQGESIQQRWHLIGRTEQSAEASSSEMDVEQQVQQRQRWRMEQLKEQLKEQHERPCIKLFTPEGLVFELNNRVPHKVSNPAASATTRIHLVIDVFESPRARTPLLPGTECEYGAVPVGALKHLQAVVEGGTGTHEEVEVVSQEIRALVASPGMSCVGPDGARVMPLRKAIMDPKETAELEKQEDMVQKLLLQLQAVAAGRGHEPHVAAAATIMDPLL